MFGKIRRFSILTFITVLFFFSNTVWGINNLMMDLAVERIEKAGPPKLVGKDVIFTYSSKEPLRFVGARFEHENYKILHTYVRNRNGVFVLIYPVPENLTKFTYRIVADGIWMADPNNPDIEYNNVDTVFSVFTVHKLPEFSIINPEIGKNRTATFYLRTSSGRSLTISGDFNNWDPFIDRFKEIKPGLYKVTIRTLPGRHYYHFLLDGKKLIDPYNLDVRQDYEDFAVSSFLMPQQQN